MSPTEVQPRSEVTDRNEFLYAPEFVSHLLFIADELKDNRVNRPVEQTLSDVRRLGGHGHVRRMQNRYF